MKKSAKLTARVVTAIYVRVLNYQKDHARIKLSPKTR